MSRKDGMYCYYDWINPLKKVPPEDFKELIIAMLEYHRDGTPPPVFGDITGVVADFIFPQIERSKKYAQNGAKGGVVTQLKTIGLSNGSTNGSTLKHKTNTKTETKTKTKTDTVSPHTPQGVKERFDRFWKEYPKKVGKQAALKAFLKIKPDEQLLQTMLKAIKEQRQTVQWQQEQGRYIPNPSTWLNRGQWTDEIGIAARDADRFKNLDLGEVL